MTTQSGGSSQGGLQVHQESEQLRIYKMGPYGSSVNNAFFLVDKATGEAALIDAIANYEAILAGVQSVGATPKMVLFTHSHPDHLESFDALRELLPVPFYMHQSDTVSDAAHGWLADDLEVEVHLAGGDTVPLGETPLQVLHTPGHTTGSLCFYSPPYCIVGDTLFPGGPGFTTSEENLRTVIESILRELYGLPDDTLTFNGHGEDARIGESIQEVVNCIMDGSLTRDGSGNTSWQRA